MVKSWKNIYRCEFNGLIEADDGFRAKVKLLDDHKGYGGSTGDYCTTSLVQSVDFVNKVIVTKNSIYQF